MRACAEAAKGAQCASVNVRDARRDLRRVPARQEKAKDRVAKTPRHPVLTATMLRVGRC